MDKEVGVPKALGWRGSCARRRVLVRALFALTMAMLVGTAATMAEGVGFRFVGAQFGDDEMPLAVWYPTEVSSGELAVGPFTMPVAADAPIASGRHGLVLISHGLGGSNLGHRDTAIRLAQAGYIVAAPQHSGDNYLDETYSGRPQNWTRRPQQMRVTLERLLADQGFSGSIDQERIAAVGHSIGGYTVLAFVGARADLERVARHCVERREEDQEFCGYGQPEDELLPVPELGDRRVAAAVAVAPVGVAFGEGAFDAVEAKVQIHRFGQDTVLRYPWHAENIAARMGENARLVVHPDVHHFAFITPFPASLAGSVGAAGRDPAGFDRASFLDVLNEQILEYLNEVLATP